MNIYLRTLRASFTKAVDWKIIRTNPFTRVALCPIPQKTPQFFTFEQFDELIQTIKEPWLLQSICITAFTGYGPAVPGRISVPERVTAPLTNVTSSSGISA